MTKVRPTATPQRETSAAPSRRTTGRPSLAIRLIVSGLLAWHLAAVFLAPLSVPPTSWLVMTVAQGPVMQWYLDLLYINHGYQFFAPDPGAGRLVRWEVYDERGGVVDRGEFPNKKEQWPRLWYHRHFMLADQAGAGPEEDGNPDFWKRKYMEAYGKHILRQSEGQSVRVRWLEHRMLRPEEGYEWAEYQRVKPDQPFRGMKPDDPATYRQLIPDVIVRRSDLGPEANSQTHLWQGGRPSVASPPTSNSPWTGVTR